MPVPPPTFPSATGPDLALSRAWKTCSGLTWNPLISLSSPSHVSATTGRDQAGNFSPRRFSCQAMTASWTTPTLWVFVISTGPSRKPDSSSQVVPVISPFPLSVNQAAKTWFSDLFPAGENGRDARPDRPLADDERTFSGYEGRQADFDAGDIGDGVIRTRPCRQMECPGRGPAAWSARRPGQRRARPVRRQERVLAFS